MNISDDDLRFIVEHATNDEYSLLLDQLLNLFRKYRLSFILIFLGEMSFTLILLFITWDKKDNAILLMHEMYNDLNLVESAHIFYFIYFISLLANLIFYPFGLISLSIKNVKTIKFFSNLILINAFLTMILIYVNV